MDSLLKNKTVKTLFFSFTLVSIFYIIVASLFGRGIVSDGIWNFYQIVNNDYISSNIDQRMRYFSCLLSQLPIYIVSAVFKFKYTALSLFVFSLPLFLFPFLVPFWNLILAKRSKRYDIAILSFFLFVFGVLFFEWYAIVECLIAIPLYMVLFHYLTYDIDYKKLDIFWIILLSVFCFHSHEFIGIFGFLLFISSFLYAKSTNISLKSKVVKYFIGLSGLLSGLLFWVFYLTPYGPDLTSDGGLGDFTHSFTVFFGDYFFFLRYRLIYTIAIVSVLLIFVISILLKKELNKISVFLMSSFLIIFSIVFFIICNKGFNLYFNDFINFSVDMRFTAAILSVPIVISILFKDFVLKAPSDNISIPLKNLFISTLIIGIFATLIQLYWTFSYKNVISNLLLNVRSSNSVIFDITKYKERKYYYAIFPPGYAPLVYLFISNNKVKNHIVLPFEYIQEKKENKFNTTEFCYDKDFDMMYSFRYDGFYYDLDIVTQYWDLSKIKKYMIENKIYCE